MNCVFWSMGDVSLQGMGHLHKVPEVLPMSPDNSVTHVPGLHRAPPNMPLQPTVRTSVRFWPILLKNSLESERLVAMLKSRRSRGRSGDDGTRVWRSEEAVLLIQSRRPRSCRAPAARD